MFLPKHIFSPKKNTCFHQKKLDQQSKQKEGHSFDLWSCFFFRFSISSCFFQFLPIFPFVYPVNSSNLNPGVWHWLLWPCLYLVWSSQRQKYIGSAGALLPGKFLHARKVFPLNILLSIISGTCLEYHWSFWKVSGSSGKFQDLLECFWIVWKVSVLSGKFPYCLESFQIFWQVTKLSGNFQKCLENVQIVSGWSVILPYCLVSFQTVWKHFQIVSKLSILSGKFSNCSYLF